MVVGLQRARGMIQKAEGAPCLSLAPEEPLSVCGFEAEPKKQRSLDRQDLFCEMVTWQWEELGDGNPGEFKSNGCAFVKEAQGKKTSARKKGGVLPPPGEL